MRFKTLIMGFVVASMLLLGAGSAAASGLMVTRYFSGLWDQVDQESQGITLQVIEQDDGSRKALAYWFTYGPDRKSAWYMGVGELVDDRIDFDLYNSTDVGFMQPAEPGNDSVVYIGSMTMTFDSCDSGTVTFATDLDDVGSGSFRIQRLTDMMNAHCSGGIADDTDVYRMHGAQQIRLQPVRSGISGSGRVRYAVNPGLSEFEVEVTGLADGTYRLMMGTVDRGEFMVSGGYGQLEFSSPMQTGQQLLGFDPHGMAIEIHDAAGAVLSSYPDMFDDDGGDYGHMGFGDHDYLCGSGGTGGMHGGMMHGMPDCVDEEDTIEIHAGFSNTGMMPQAEGEAEWEMSSERVAFSLEIEGVPSGTYRVRVGGIEVGAMTAGYMHGMTVGIMRFRDPEVFGMGHLDFDPRGQSVQVMSAEGEVILQTEFPSE